jgi:hypothetical protein
MSLEVLAENCNSPSSQNQDSSIHYQLPSVGVSTPEISSNLKIYNNHQTICDDKTIKIYNQHGALVFFMYIPTGVQNQIGN